MQNKRLIPRKPSLRFFIILTAIIKQQGARILFFKFALTIIGLCAKNEAWK